MIARNAYHRLMYVWQEYPEFFRGFCGRPILDLVPLQHPIASIGRQCAAEELEYLSCERDPSILGHRVQSPIESRKEVGARQRLQGTQVRPPGFGAALQVERMPHSTLADIPEDSRMRVPLGLNLGDEHSNAFVDVATVAENDDRAQRCRSPVGIPIPSEDVALGEL
jgi:hypothetical protein